MAMWDAFNGSGTGTKLTGIPSGWQAYVYWSATPSSYGHAFVNLGYGRVDDNFDTFDAYVALEVL